MAKLLVTDAQEGTKMPFLRGILTRSLQDIGLDFDEAYDLASDLRDDLNRESRIETGELRKLVTARLREAHGDYLANRYDARAQAGDPVTIRGEDGNLSPFSVDVHSKSLELCGIAADDARKLSRVLGRHLISRKRHEVKVPYLAKFTYRMLARDVGKEVAKRYLVWREFSRSGVPLLLLIGGAPGSGKSTIATTLASRLDIFRTQSTDMLREVMRIMMPERLLPVLHRSSFEAWRALPDSGERCDHDDPIANGYRSQAELLTVSCEAVVQRAVRERVSMVLEGVHIDPMVVKRLRESGEIIVVPIMLGILKQDLLRNRIRGRGGAVPHRRAERYLKNFDAIWQLQSYLLSEADRAQISIVVNEDKEHTVAEILRIIGDALSRELGSTVQQVFPSTG